MRYTFIFTLILSSLFFSALYADKEPGWVVNQNAIIKKVEDWSNQQSQPKWQAPPFQKAKKKKNKP